MSRPMKPIPALLVVLTAVAAGFALLALFALSVGIDVGWPV